MPIQLSQRKAPAKVSGADARPTGRGLRQLGDYFVASRTPPKLSGGDTIEGFNQAQLTWLYGTYWSADPGANLDELYALAKKSPAFEGRPELDRRALGRVISAFPDSFPWEWSRRNTVCGAYTLVDALVRAPKGESVASICRALKERYPTVSSHSAFVLAAKTTWLENGADFPFLDVLEKGPNGYALQARGAPVETALDFNNRGRLAWSEKNARAIASAMRDPDVKLGWEPKDYFRFIGEKLDAPFDDAAFYNFRSRFKAIVPTVIEVQGEKLEAFLRHLTEVMQERDFANGTELFETMHREFGYPLYQPKDLTYFRSRFSWVPNLKEAKRDATARHAKAIVDAFVGGEADSFADAARQLGVPEARRDYIANKAAALHRAEVGLVRKVERYDDQDVQAIRAAYERLPIGASPPELFALVAERSPRFAQRHDFKHHSNFARVAKETLDIDDWAIEQRSLLAELMAKVAPTMREGFTSSELYDAMNEVRPIGFTRLTVRDLRSLWNRSTALPERIEKLRDAEGHFPWQHGSASLNQRHARQLAAFAGFYPQASNTPSLPPGETLDGFNESQLRTLHQLYWSMPPMATIDELATEAGRRPAFKNAGELAHKAKIGRLFGKRRDSFPWPWPSRGLTLGSYLFVQALQEAPSGSLVADVAPRLKGEWGAFFKDQQFRVCSRTSWVKEPERFPFLEELPKKDGKVSLESLIPQDPLGLRRGYLTLNPELAQKVIEIADAHLLADMSLDEFTGLVSRELEAPFTKGTFSNLNYQADTKAFMLNFSQLKERARERLKKTVHAIREERGINDRAELVRLLETEFGYQHLTVSRLSGLLADDPTLRFRAMKRDVIEGEAKRLMEAIEASPEQSHRQTAQSLGMSDNKFSHLLTVIREEWPGRIEYKPRRSDAFSTEEKRQLLDAANAVPIGSAPADVLTKLAELHPQFLEARPMQFTSFRSALRRELGKPWHEHQHERLEALIVDVVGKSREPMTQDELFKFLQDEHGLRYTVPTFRELLSEWKNDPDGHPLFASTRSADGRYFWELARVDLSEELAKVVGDVIRQNEGATTADVSRILRADSSFRERYPAFNAAVHVARLRRMYGDELVPKLTEYVIDGPARHAARFETDEALAQRALQHLKKRGSIEGITVDKLAREMKVGMARLNKAIAANHEDFPWFRRSTQWSVDRRMALQVAAAIEQAPIGVSTADIVRTVNADPEFRKRYPGFTPASFYQLYHEPWSKLVPRLTERNAILRSKLFVDALLVAPMGTPVKQIIADLAREHGAAFEGKFSEPSHFAFKWREHPRRYPFIEALRDDDGVIRLTAKGREPLPKEPDLKIAAQLATLERLPETLPAVDAIADKLGPRYFEQFELVAVQHLLDSQVPTFDAYARAGFHQDRTSIVGVPYSSNDEVVSEMRKRGWEVTAPPLDLETWTEDIRQALYDRVASARESGRRIIALDDGGLVTELLHSDPYLHQNADLFRVVEQTRRGITVADTLDLKTPVINVGQDWGKYVEGPLIADSIDVALVSRLKRIGITSLKGMEVGIVGAGTIGLPMAYALKAMGAHVTLLDPDTEATEKVKKDFAIADPEDRQQFFSGKAMILGASGVQSIHTDDFAYLDDGAVIGSVSSKLVEIDVSGLAELAEGPPRVIDRESHPPTVEYTMPDGRKIRVLARGYPLNFDGGPETIPPDEIQLTRALMLIGAAQAARTTTAGVNRLDVPLQQELLKILEGLGFGAGDPDKIEALEIAQRELHLAATEGGHYRRKT